MRRPELRLKIRHRVVSVAIAAVGLFLLRAICGMGEEVIIRQYSENWRPWNRGDTVRVRLDIDRLRAYDLSKDDVMKALGESRMVDPSEPKRVDPPPGVVFVTRLDKPDRYENIILKANAEGEIVRLRDVAKVEVGW
jgi:AcrB/AcrD/AcrF family